MVVTLVLFSNAPLPLSQLLPLLSLHFPPSWIMIIAFLKAYLRVVVFFILHIYFICFWLCCVFIAARAFLQL